MEFQYFSQIRPNQQPSPPISTLSILKHQNGNRNRGKVRLLCLEEKDGAVAEIKVDEVLGLMRNEGAEVASDNAVPGRPLALIEGLLDELSNVLLDSIFGHSLLCNVNGFLLHVIRHVCAFDLSLKLILRADTLLGCHDFGVIVIGEVETWTSAMCGLVGGCFLQRGLFARLGIGICTVLAEQGGRVGCRRFEFLIIRQQEVSVN